MIHSPWYGSDPLLVQTAISYGSDPLDRRECFQLELREATAGWGSVDLKHKSTFTMQKDINTKIYWYKNTKYKNMCKITEIVYLCQAPQHKCWALIRITIDSWLLRSVVLNHIQLFWFRFIWEILPWNESVSCESCGWKLGVWRRQKVKGVAAIKSLDLWSPHVWNLTLSDRIRSGNLTILTPYVVDLSRKHLKLVLWSFPSCSHTFETEPASPTT